MQFKLYIDPYIVFTCHNGIISFDVFTEQQSVFSVGYEFNSKTILTFTSPFSGFF